MKSNDRTIKISKKTHKTLKDLKETRRQPIKVIVDIAVEDLKCKEK